MVKATDDVNRMDPSSAEDFDRSSDQIRADIDRTRAEMDETVDELQSRMSLDYISHNALDAVRSGAGACARKIGTVVRENPLPSAVIAAGIIWMLVSKKKKSRGPQYVSSYDEDEDVYGEYVSGVGDQAGTTRKMRRAAKRAASTIKDRASHLTQQAEEKVQNLGRTVKDKVQGVSSQAVHKVEDAGAYAREKAVQLGHQVQHGAQQGRDWFVHTVDEYPLAVTAAFFTMGLAGGLAVPSTRKEDELLGPMRDNLMDHAQAAGADLIHKGEEAAERAVSCAREAVASETASESSPSGRQDDFERDRENSM